MSGIAYPSLSHEELWDIDIEHLVYVEESPTWPGLMVWQHSNDQWFTSTYSDYVSRRGLINEHFMIDAFVKRLQADGLAVSFDPNCNDILADHIRHHAPLEIDGLDLRWPDGTKSDLFDYQRYTLNRALERAHGPTAADRYLLYGWGAGTGKSAVSAGGAQMLFNAGLIDLAVVMTMPTLKIDLLEFFTSTTPLNAVLADGTKTRREKLWRDLDVQVYVTNYEKAHWDIDLILERTAGKRVLFVFDEVAKILTDGGQTLARKALDLIMKGCTPTCWPMTATAVDYSPFRYRDVFSLSLRPKDNPLGTKKDFESQYVAKKQSYRMKGANGGSFVTTNYTWNHTELHDVRHRIGYCTQNARRTDPGIRENFPDFDVIPKYVQLNADDRTLYDVVKGWASAARQRGESRAPHLEVLRYICNTPAAVGVTSNPVGVELAKLHPGLVDAAAARDSSKLESFIEQLQQFRDAQDKVVAFSKWTNLGLLLLAPELERRGIKFALHHGGLSTGANQEAKTLFKTDPSITCLFSSDAGQRGLNLPEAIAEISYDCPYSWDTQNQRQSRIIRANSLYYDKRPRIAYVYVTQGTCEMEIYRTMMGRRRLAEVTTGTSELLSISSDDVEPEDEPSIDDTDRMIFGDSDG